ncbi:GNAT family N-acetyltransferase [Acidovorax sp. NPDC077693]|uniref:GNAT family N-acetyltransferase n=1 Tax=unclassified Acidovorax TaxID=2684926 RepID=UPI0037C51186
MLSHLTFAPPTDDDLRDGTLGRQLRQYNYRFVGEYPAQQPVRLDARDAQGRLVGGIRGFVFVYWLNIDVLWVADDHRGQGLGTHLLGWAEAQGRTLGAHHARLDSFEWQARGFYIQQGYTEFARIEDYLPGQYLAFMKKPLA